MKKTFLLLLLLLSGQAFAQKIDRINSIKELTDSIAVIVKNKQIPGLMLGITTRDSVLFSGGIGHADLENDRPVSNQTLFRMGSITKSIVSLAVLKLAAEGKIDLNDELKKIAPDVPFKNPWEKTNPVRVIHLMEHTTGFDDFKINRMYSLERKDLTAKEMMLIQEPSMQCRWKPSERFSYSNVNYAILGYLIAKISGTSYEQYLMSNVMQPIGMTHSNFNLYSKFPSQDAKEYSRSGDKIQLVPSVSFLIGPAGALWSDANDMVRFVQFFLGNGGPMLDSASMKKMETPQSSSSARAGILAGYALGNEYIDGFRGHRGQLGTFKSIYKYNRELGVGFVMSSNGNGMANIEGLITDYLLKNKSFPKTKTARLDSKAIAPYLGYYQTENPRFGFLGFMDRLLLLKVEEENDTLLFNIFFNKWRVLPTGRTSFTNISSNNSNIVFLENDGKKVLIMNDRYSEKVSGTWALISRLVLLLSFLFAFLAIIPAIIGTVQLVRRKITGQMWLLRSLPAIAFLCLIVAMYNFLSIYDHSHFLYKLADVTTTSVIIFGGTLLFGLLSAVNLFNLIFRYKSIQNRAAALYFMTTAFSLIIITILLSVNGWIGLRTWAM